MELALLAPVMVILVMGVLDLGRAYRMNIRLENAAREGAAFAQVYPNDVASCPSGDSILGQVEREEPALKASPAFTIVVEGQGAGGTFTPMSGCAGTVATAGERVRVRVSARYDIMTPLVSQAVGTSLTLTGDAEVRVQGQVRP